MCYAHRYRKLLNLHNELIAWLYDSYRVPTTALARVAEFGTVAATVCFAFLWLLCGAVPLCLVRGIYYAAQACARVH